MRAAGSAEGKTKERPERPVVRDPPLLRPSRRRSILFAVEALLLIASVTAAILLSDAEQWQPPELVGLLAVLASGSDFLTLETKRVAHLGRVPGARPEHGVARPGAGGRDRPRLRDRRRAPLAHARHLPARQRSSTYTFFPLVGGIVLQAINETSFAERGRLRVLGVRRVLRDERPELHDGGRAHRPDAGRVAARDVRARVPAGRAVGAGDRLDDRDGRLRLRALRHRRRRAVRARPRRLPAAAALAAEGARARRGGAAAQGPARRPPRGHGRAPARDARAARSRAPPGTPRRSPTTRASSRVRPA